VRSGLSRGTRDKGSAALHRRPGCRAPLLAVVILLLANGVSNAQSLRGNEDEIKTAFLINFVKLVEWPATAFSAENEPLRVCVVGNEAIAARLQQALNGTVVAGRPVTVTRIRHADDTRHCRMLFVGAHEGKNLGTILQPLANVPVLTVGETNGFAQAGGIINFFLQSDGVRFEINLDAAERAGLKINSRVLGLARIIGEQRKD
jgi:uncharacterized protein DUF4154